MQQQFIDLISKINQVSIDTTKDLIELNTRAFEKFSQKQVELVTEAIEVGQKGQFGQTNYSAAKAGIHGFTMALAQEVAYKGVTMNTISPGYVDTRMTHAMPDDIREKIVSTIPIGRMAKPSEIAQAVNFLCDDNSNYITGANIPVNGGLYMT